ncbi:MAG TPA: helix-turn-helix domain-containing protein, partial [Terriglobales bacterium]|nr:helix-turn-helix domain-containing protein [Terriglobales bacterium]
MPTTARDLAAMEARRLHAARLFARGESQVAVAKALGVTRVSAHHWYHAWKAHGRAGLKGAGRAGRKPRLDAAQLAEVERALVSGHPIIPSCGHRIFLTPPDRGGRAHERDNVVRTGASGRGHWP